MTTGFASRRSLPPVRCWSTPVGRLVDWDSTLGGATAERGGQLVDLWPDRPGEVLVVDLSGLHLMATAAVEDLLRAVVVLADRGFDVRLCNPQPLVGMALFLMGVPAGVGLYDDVPAAAAGHAGGRVEDRGYL
ncbi:STAS domain-containing protein [Actinocatenispora sera]|uniref:STAS domain-containing protein n=1 Tax=Actinocatenispora sera TaxID=390989 RepID=UPI0012EDC284|nr:STAS domain-containing protein [Actinocatenispora sera]